MMNFRIYATTIKNCEKLGTSDFKMHKHYPLNTIKDNARLLDSELLDSINKEVVKAGCRK